MFLPLDRLPDVGNQVQHHLVPEGLDQLLLLLRARSPLVLQWVRRPDGQQVSEEGEDELQRVVVPIITVHAALGQGVFQEGDEDAKDVRVGEELGFVFLQNGVLGEGVVSDVALRRAKW